MVARNKIVIKGSLGDGNIEKWATSIHFGGPGGFFAISGPSELAEWADDVMGILGALPAEPLRSLLSSEGTIDSVSAYYYDPGPGPAVAVGESSVVPILGGGTPTNPPQISVVFSLLTGLAGRSFRGRNYWPAIGAPMSLTTLRIQPQFPPTYATAWADTLEAIAAAGSPTSEFNACVYSPTRNALTTVSQVSVGDVFDTQRSRRDDMVEVRSSALVTPQS